MRPVLLVLPLFTACAAAEPAHRPSHPPSDNAETWLDATLLGPGFAMRNQDGVLVSGEDLLGHPVLIDIGFVG